MSEESQIIKEQTYYDFCPEILFSLVNNADAETEISEDTPVFKWKRKEVNSRDVFDFEVDTID